MSYAASRRTYKVRGGSSRLALVLVALVHLGLGLMLLSAFDVRVERARELVTRLVDVHLLPPPPPVPPPPLPPKPQPKPRSRPAAARARSAPKGGPTGPAKAKIVAPTATPVPRATAPAPGGGRGSGPSAGIGAGGGSGGNGNGDGDGEGGTDLVQVAGAITHADYPVDLPPVDRDRRVSMLFTVAATGRVSHCSVTRSSGIAMLDALTCRLVVERFRYRPSLDARGRPIADEVDGDYDWRRTR